MKYALISDVHGNLPALDAVLSDIAQRRDVAATYHLGDLVGYGPWPNEVVRLITASGIAGVAGNYDTTVATNYRHCGCKYEDPKQEALSHASFTWTLTHVERDVRKQLAALPFRLDLRPLGGHAAGPTVTLLHGNQVLNTVYVHDERPDSFLENMGEAVNAKSGDVVCFGHTHRPWRREVAGIHFINTGSVGRPKDGDWRAGYVILDVEPARVDVAFIRVEYDLSAAIRGIERSDLPNEFATFLLGWMPGPVGSFGATVPGLSLSQSLAVELGSPVSSRKPASSA